jgi:hypothetical protein
LWKLGIRECSENPFRRVPDPGVANVNPTIVVLVITRYPDQ